MKEHHAWKNIKKYRAENPDWRERHGDAMRGKLAGSNNPAWKGGRGYSGGYVRVFVGPDHPLADSRGRAYEHNLVAYEKLGRLLMRDEVVHHINEIKDDNRPENIVVLTRAQHMALHKPKSSRNGGRKQ